MMEGLGMCGYFSSSSGLHSTSSSSSSELRERLRQGGGDSKHWSSFWSCRWQAEFELIPFTFLAPVEWLEMQLTVLCGCLCCWSSAWGMPVETSGWEITGSPLLFLLRPELVGSWGGAGSVLTSDGFPKQWARDEQGSPCMLVDLQITRRDNKTNPNCTDIRWICFPVWGATSGS